MILLTILDPKTVRLPDGSVVRDRTPILEACRRLIADGIDSKTRFQRGGTAPHTPRCWARSAGPPSWTWLSGIAADFNSSGGANIPA